MQGEIKMVHFRWLPCLACVGLLTLLALTAPGCNCRSDGEADPDAPWSEANLPSLVDAAELKETDVLPHAKGPITPGRNYLCCATFQLAWNQFEDEFTKGPILLEGSPEMAGFLNQREVEKGILSEDSYLAMAGRFSDGIVDDIRTQMNKRFPSAQSVMLKDLEKDADSTALIAYAFLQKSLPFKEKFEDVRPIVFRSKEADVSVRSFGVEKFKPGSEEHAPLGKQVTILDYVGDDDFILELNTTLPDEELVLAKVSPGQSLDATVAAVLRRIEEPLGQSFASGLERDEELAVPVVSLGIRRNYKELLDLYLLNPGFEEYFVAYAQQATQFRLDATGAKLKSEAAVEPVKTAAMESTPRRLVFDKPFLVLLRESDADAPYFALWVETPEVMEPIR
jgi:hypothetical protein